MNTPYSLSLSTKQKRKDRNAFALVLSLALMGFMVLLIVTLATMVQMQMRLSRQAMIDFKAKQAAKFAAYQAMSRVQSALGPDTRVSANAMMFDPTVSTAITALEADTDKYDWWTSPMDISREEVNEIDGAISQNRYWVGVWDSRRGYHPSLIKRDEDREDYITNTVEKSLTWLVSGNIVKKATLDNSQRPTYLPTDQLQDGEYVRLVAGGSSSDAFGARDPNLDVRAPLVKLDVDANVVTGEKITDGKETRIAWWVSDENQKASLNAVAKKDVLEHATTINYRIQSMPFYSGIHGVTLPGSGNTAGQKVFDFDFSDSGDESSISRIRSLSHVSQLDIFRSGEIPENIQLSKIFFHSASFDTKGLLVNVRDGGMKKDLSLGLARYADNGRGFGNETEIVGDSDNPKSPRYFHKPYGVSGYDFKTSAYPLQTDKVNKYHLNPILANEPERVLKGKGHIFGPQMYGNEHIEDAEKLSTLQFVRDMFSDKYIWKDPGGPLWDQLRSYYNLRTEDLADNATLNERVQTDDRYGFKPVVKRFQVFFVPTFINYSGQKYGLRLHIMPLLILYNPYDTKVKGDTYYAIRLRGHPRHPVGAFRFAIGYKMNYNGKLYFQCLRDLRTEMLPSLMDSVIGPSPTAKHLRQYTVPFRLGASYYNNRPAADKGKYIANDTRDGVYVDNDSNSSRKGAPTFYTMSRFTKFYNGFNIKPSRRVPAFPLGYGEKLPVNTVIARQAFAKSTIERIQKDPDGDKINGYSKYRGTDFIFNHWQGIVAANNVYPQKDFSDEKGYSAKVARIPLFLNNILYAVSHGTYVDRNMVKTEGNENYYLFVAQRSIDSRYNTKINSEFRANAEDDANLFFMAYDEKGLEPGKAKVFTMGGLVNYVGDPTSTYASKTDNTMGPNGLIESAKGESRYVENKALMYPLGEGGVPGGCFYVDVPHPEWEHAQKFNEDNYIVTPNDKYIMFDLALINNDVKGFDGNQMPKSIGSYYIDMSDITGIYPRNEMTSEKAARPFGATFNMTPIGYGIGAYNGDYSMQQDSVSNDSDNNRSSYWNQKHEHNLEYRRVELDIWIWKREGFEFGRYSKNGTSSGDWQYTRAIMGPSLMHMKGERHFLYKEPSFPDAASIPEYSKSLSRESSNKRVTMNFHCPGKVYTSNGVNPSKGLCVAAMRNTRYSAWGSGEQPSTIDSFLVTKGAALSSERKYDKTEKEFFGIEDGNSIVGFGHKGRANARFYLNWLPFNARRHSANYWLWYDDSRLNSDPYYDQDNPPQSCDVPATNEPGGSNRMTEPVKRNEDLLGDTLPQSIQPVPSGRLSVNLGYADALNSTISNSEEYVPPYGYVFGIPYADNEPGHEPVFNARPFVNTNIQATGYYADGSARTLKKHESSSMLYNKFSVMPKHTQATNHAYGEEVRGKSNGLSDTGYKTYTMGANEPSVGLKEQGGARLAPIFHILRKTEVVSNVANLTSANLTFGVGRYWGKDYQSQGNPEYTRENTQRSYAMQAYEHQHPSFALGNSLCPSRISPERPYQVTWIDGASAEWDKNTGGDSGEQYGKHNGKRDQKSYQNSNYVEDRNVLYDMSWLLNDALWDEYYFSTLPYRNDERENTVDNEIAYPQNPRLQYYIPKEEQLMLSDLISEANENQFEENSSMMWVNGAFNVNSTSIDAWKAVLSTYYGTEVRDYQGKSKIVENAAPFSRWTAPYSVDEFTIDSSIDMEDSAFKGFRSLNDDEIEKLATAIVEHVKDRGPFYSMSHFVNRVSAVMSAEQRYTESIGENNIDMPTKEDDRKNLEDEYDGIITHKIGHTQKGVLQAAIDSTSINSAYHKDDNLIISVNNDRNVSYTWSGMVSDEMKDPKTFWENWRGAVGPQATGAPTYLMQQDILSKLGSFLTVRSDTFKIRAYGEVRNPISGAVEGKAWCEMVVQRTPEYIDQDTRDQEAWRVSGREHEIGFQNTQGVKDAKEYNEHVDELSALNKELGRRFKIVSFRWLNEKEI